MYGGQLDGASLFSGGGFMPSQATQVPDSGYSPAKRSSAQSVLPLTVKQISEAYHLNDDKSNFTVDGVEATNVRLLGMAINKMERVTDVSFTLDDGTGRIDINRWVNDASETNEMAVIQNGMYVKVNGHLKGFQGKKHAVAFCVRPVTDFNDVALHFLDCIHVHLAHTRLKVQGADTYTFTTSSTMGTPSRYQKGVMTQQAPPPNQFSVHSANYGSDNEIEKVVMGVFQEPASLAREHGLHVDEVVQRLGIPSNKIKQAIEYLVEGGHIYSTVDDYHFRSAING